MKDCVITITVKNDKLTTKIDMETKSGSKVLYTASELMDAYSIIHLARRSLRSLGFGLKQKLWELAEKGLTSEKGNRATLEIKSEQKPFKI